MVLENGGDDFILKFFYYEVVVVKICSYLRCVYGDYVLKLEEWMIE